MLEGIPYIKQNLDDILSADYTENVLVTTVYSFVQEFKHKRVVINTGLGFLSYVKDIKFNYRDKICYLPYFTYQLKQINPDLVDKDIEKHLFYDEEEGFVYIRYEYNYETLNIDLNSQLLCYDLDENEAFTVKFTAWYKGDFDIDKLYKLYINSSFNTELFSENDKGYHYIKKQVKKIYNLEAVVRKNMCLLDYSEKMKPIEDYRDVRNYKYDAIVQSYGLIDTLDNYKIRRLDFESYLFCNIQEGNLDYLKLRKGTDYYKYGNELPLIIKGYWFPKNKQSKKWSWVK